MASLGSGSRFGTQPASTSDDGACTSKNPAASSTSTSMTRKRLGFPRSILTA